MLGLWLPAQSHSRPSAGPSLDGGAIAFHWMVLQLWCNLPPPLQAGTVDYSEDKALMGLHMAMSKQQVSSLGGVRDVLLCCCAGGFEGSEGRGGSPPRDLGACCQFPSLHSSSFQSTPCCLNRHELKVMPLPTHDDMLQCPCVL